jgi:hypothetical protein
MGCKSLASVTIPSSVTSIDLIDLTVDGHGSKGVIAFGYCTSLTAITVASGNTAYSSVDGVLYNKSKTDLFTYPGGKSGTSFTIPDIRKTARFT